VIRVRPEVLRLAALAAGVLAWASVAAGRPQGVLTVVTIAVAVLSVLAPAGAAPTALLLLLVAVQLAEGGLDLRLPFTVAALAAHHALCAFLAELPDDAWVQLDVLRRPLQQFLGVQAGSLLVFGGALTVRRLDRSLPDAAVLGVTVALVAATSVVGMAVARFLTQGRRQGR
jgi:hypothetical protein